MAYGAASAFLEKRDVLYSGRKRWSAPTHQNSSKETPVGGGLLVGQRPRYRAGPLAFMSLWIAATKPPTFMAQEMPQIVR
jgi:hypothetical protein